MKTLREIRTHYGRAFVALKPSLFSEAARIANAAAAGRIQCSVAMSGGPTAHAFFDWCVNTDAPLNLALLHRAQWFTSEDNYTPLTSNESNFGYLSRKLLDPLNIPESQRHPWNVALRPADCAIAMCYELAELGSPSRSFDLCFLNLGLDGSIASIFPQSRLLTASLHRGAHHEAVQTPDQGSWKLTISATGIYACERIVVLVAGAEKAAITKKVLFGEFDPMQLPAQILKAVPQKVIWLIDEEAASEMSQ